MKVVLHFRASAALEQRFRAALPEWVEFVAVPEDDAARARHELADADVLLHVLEPVTPELLAEADRLRFIQKIGVGVNTIDLALAGQRGIKVANMPGTNSAAVCELTLTLMLATLRRVVLLDRATRSGRGWELPAGTTDSCAEIGGRTVGLIGYGAVPERLAPVLEALGAEVVFHRREVAGTESGRPLPLADLLGCADVISLHVPLTDATRSLIGAEAFAAMKPGAVLVNTARGELVDEAALIAALESGRLGGAGLDVFESEPTAADNPLFRFDNVVVTPHLAWLTVETIGRSLEVIADNLSRLESGAPLRHEVPV